MVLLHRVCQVCLLVALVLSATLSCVSGRLAVMSIDLGGEFMKMAIVKPGVPMEIVLNKESSRKTVSMVAFRDGDRHFGNQAQSTAIKFPQKAFFYLNSIIGRHYDDPQVKKYRERFPYYNTMKDEKRGTLLFQLEDKSVYSVEELLGMILEKAREYAQEFAEQEIKDAVITVPAFYNQAERRSVMTAASLVGINVLQLISDNAAVALNYGVFRRKNFNSTMQYYMFYDLGATSTTVSIVGYNVVKTKEGSFMESNPQLTMKGIGFDRSLGGIEFTMRLRSHLAKLFDEQKKTSMKVTESPRAMAKLLKEAERVKKVLSANIEHQAQIEGLLDEKDFRAPVTRAELEEMTSDLLDRVTKPIEEALKVSEITLPEISEIILMGGVTRMPKVQEILVKYLGRTELGKSINTDEAAALGAVYQAAYLGKGFKVKKFGVREGNIYPINVEFEKQKASDADSEEKARVIKRTLFGRMNPYPQKKVMTFNKHTKDFGFNVLYSNLDFLTHGDQKSFGSHEISSYKLSGVEDALSKHKDQSDAKGIKAHFRMDESGVLTLDKVESVFEKNASVEAEGEKSTWSKLGSAIGGLFGGSSQDDDTKVEESTEEESSDAGAGEGAGTEESKDGGDSKSSSKPEEAARKKEGEEEAPAKTEEEEEAKQEGQKDKPEEKETPEQTKDGQSEKVSDDDAKKNKTETEGGEEKGKSTKAEDEAKKEKVPKVVTVKEDIQVEMDLKDVKEIPKDLFKESVKRLSELRLADKEKAELEKIKNELEAFIFDFQDKLNEGKHSECATEEQKSNLMTQFSEASDWLYEQPEDTKKSEYYAKLRALKDSTKDLSRRVYEMEERPKALETLRTVLNQTSVFLETVKNMTDIEDPIFTQVEMDTLEKLINESKAWRNENVAAQKKLNKYETPAFFVEQVGEKIAALDREMRYLINKAKNFKPKPKPKEEKKEANETVTPKGTQSNETTTEESKTESQEEKPPTDEKASESAGPTVDIPGQETTGKRRPKSKRKQEEESSEQAEPLELDGPEKEDDLSSPDSSNKDKTKAEEEKHVEL